MTKLKILIIVIALALAGNLNAQDYKKYNYNIQMAGIQDNNDSVIFYIEKAFEYSNIPLLDDVLRITRAYAKRGNTTNFKNLENSVLGDAISTTNAHAKAGDEEKIIKYFKILYRHGYSFDDVFLSSYSPVKISNELTVKLKKIQIPKIDFDIDFISEFSEYVGRQQFLIHYMHYDTCIVNYSYLPDSIDHISLKNYIVKYGYPDESRIGKYSWIPMTLINHHILNRTSHNNWNDYYKPLFLELASKGKYSYSNIVSLDDMYNMAFNGYQLYGTNCMARGIKQSMTSAEIKELPRDLMVPIKDIKNLDKRRAEMGLPPYYIYAKSLNIVLPEDYKPEK